MDILIIYVRLEFSLSDAIFILFIHDLEKPFKYIEPSFKFKNREEESTFKLKILKDYQIKLEDSHLNALKYIHGEGDDYCEDRVMGTLATFCHVCDITSARIWYNLKK